MRGRDAPPYHVAPGRGCHADRARSVTARRRSRRDGLLPRPPGESPGMRSAAVRSFSTVVPCVTQIASRALRRRNSQSRRRIGVRVNWVRVEDSDPVLCHPERAGESRDLRLGFSQRAQTAQRAQRTASGRSAPNVISRGARGDRGGTTRGERPWGRDRCTRAPRLSSHDFKIFDGSGAEISPLGSASSAGRGGRGFSGASLRALRVKSLARSSRNAERPRSAEASRGRSSNSSTH